MTTNISKTILNTIKKENIKPKSKWHFTLCHFVLWFPGVIVTTVGAIAVAGILYAIAHSGWEYNEFVYRSKFDFFFASAPFLWIISFILFSSLIVKALRTTHLGYKLSAKKIILGSFVTSILLGFFGYTVDEKLKVNSLIRYPVHIREEGLWSLPKEGRISGVIEQKYENFLTVRGKDNILWTVDISGFGSTTFPFVKEGESIRILGTSTEIIIIDEKNNDHSFLACALFPWEIGERNKRPRAPLPNMIKPKIHPDNKNPDCKVLLEEMKEKMKFRERK